MTKGKNPVGDNSQQGKDNLRWSEEMDLALLNALLDEEHKGNRSNGTWSTEAYNNVVDLLRSTITPQITKQHIKNRLKTMKENFGEAFDLFHSLSGFAWNPMSRKFEAKEEVWEDLIKVKPNAAKWKRMQIKHYDLLVELFGADRATGKQSWTSKGMTNRWEKEKQSFDLNDALRDAGMPDVVANTDDENPYSPVPFETYSPALGHSNQSTGTSGSRGTKREAPMTDILEAQYDKISLGINALAEAVKDGNDISRELQMATERHIAVAEKQVAIAEKGLSIMEQSRPRVYSESEVWNLLTDLGLLNPYKIACYRYLCANDLKKREIFGVPPEMRLQALIDVMSEVGIQ